MHTPTPWIYDDSFRYYASRVIRRNGEIVCSFTSPYEGADDDNAQFVVRACNAHEELVEVLRDLREFASDLLGPYDTRNPEDVPEIVAADTALARAEREEG